jgi:hypothetical protein
MKLCNRIYYSRVYWRFNIFRAAHRSSSGALNCICSLWFIYPSGDRPLPRLSEKWIFFIYFTSPFQLYRFALFILFFIYRFYVFQLQQIVLRQLSLSALLSYIKILIMKSNEMHYFSNLFDENTLHVSDMSTVHHQEYLNTVHRQYVFVMLVLLASANMVRMTILSNKFEK